jgi:hypothetical protein
MAVAITVIALIGSAVATKRLRAGVTELTSIHQWTPHSALRRKPV